MKTIQVDLLPTKEQQKLIDEGMRQTNKVMVETAKRIPSIPEKTVKRQTADCYYNWNREFRNNGISLTAQCCQEAIDKVRGNYLQMETTRRERWANYFRRRERGKKPKKPSKIPIYNRKDLLRFHNQAFNLKKENGSWYLDCAIFPRNRIKIPIKEGKLQKNYFERLKEKEITYGASELKKGNGYKFYLVVRDDYPKPDKNIEHIVGIDLGLINIATLSVIDKRGNIKEVEFFDGKEAGQLRKICYDKRKFLYKKSNLRKVRKIRGYENKWMDNHNHNISRRVIEICKKYKNPIIVFENLKNIRKTIESRNELKGKAKKRRNRRLSSWTFSKLKDYVIYKAEFNGIPITEVKPANTSRYCRRCRNVDEENRNGSLFRCTKCGYEVNADLNGSLNIGFRALKNSL